MLEEIIIKCSRLVLRQVRQLEVLFEYWSGIQLPFKSPTFSCPVFRCYSKIRTFALYHLKFGLVWYSDGHWILFWHCWWGAVVWWAYSSCISLTAPRVEGSNPGRSSFFYFVNVPSANWCEERWVRSPARRKAGAATIERRKTSRRFWNGIYEKWFGSFRRRLNG